MARRKSFKKRSSRRATPKRTSRRRRVGATALSMSVNSPWVKWGSVLLGYLAGEKANEKMLAMINKDGKVTLKPEYLGYAEAGLGLLLLMKKGKKSLPLAIAGGFALGAGVKASMKSLGIGAIGPYGRMPVIGGAYGNVPVVGKRLGNYTPSSSLGNYTPSMSLGGKVMGSVFDKASGSGLMANAGSDLMGG